MAPKRARKADASKQPVNEDHVSSTVDDGAAGVEAELPTKRPTRKAQKPAVIESPIVVAKPGRGRAKKDNRTAESVAKSTSTAKPKKTKTTNGHDENNDDDSNDNKKAAASTKPSAEKKSKATKAAAQPAPSKDSKKQEEPENGAPPMKDTKGRKAATKVKIEPTNESKKDEAPSSKRKKANAKSAAKENLTEPENAPDKEEASTSTRKKASTKPTAKANADKPKPVAKSKRGTKATEEVQEDVDDNGMDDIDGGILGKGGSKKDGSSKKSAKKSKKENQSADEDDAEEPPSDEGGVTKRKKPTPKTADKGDKPKLNATTTDFTAINFAGDKDHTLKICSWNVAGLRALVNKEGHGYFEHERPDIICLQEIKCLQEEVPDQVRLKDYHPYWCSTPGGRGGVALLTRKMPYNVDFNLGDAEMDEEGRIITADYTKFFLVCVYVPNAGRKLVNLDRRLRWNKLFEAHVKKLKERKPVIICGDMNVAHNPIDLANPKTNTKNAGFSKEERAGMDDLLGLGFIDTFRHLYPNRDKAYTFWTYMGQARQKNVGWRLDYSIVSENLAGKVVDSFMREPVLGSDHCPIILLLNI